jgi:hypothetical protein
MGRKNLIIISVILCFFYGNVSAQEGVSSHKPEKRFSNYEDCIKNFNIEDVDFSEPVVQKNLNLLLDYFQCRAAAKHDITECDKLGSPLDKMCRHPFSKIFEFFGELIFNGRVTMRALDACKFPGLAEDRVTCKKFAEAFLKSDVSFCESLMSKKSQNMCKAIITLDLKWYSEGDWADNINYLKALKDFNKEHCMKIKDRVLRSGCEVFLSGNEQICNENKGFQSFRENYCREVLRGGER